MKNVLITGGMGFIGSHTVTVLAGAGYNPIIFDNLSNSLDQTLQGMEKIVGRKIDFVKGDIRNKDDLIGVFDRYKIDAVIHFAALKAVGESCEKVGIYFENNVSGTINLLNVMNQFGVKNIVFSSSCTVYGNKSAPISEDAGIGETTNPYGRSKVLCEYLLQDYAKFGKMNVIALRYFNPIGAHPSGIIGESVPGVPSNVFPYICKVMNGELDELKIFGGDYPTRDGTGVRDYIDIMDLADGHLSALNYLFDLKDDNGFYDVINLGTGKGTSVLELVNAVEKISGRKVQYKIVERRQGDLAEVYGDVRKADDVLGWKAKFGIEDSVRNFIRFQGK